MFIGALQQDQRWGRLGPLPHLLGGRGALGDLSRHRLGVVRGRGPLYRVSRAPPSASNFPQQTEDLCEGKGGTRARDKSFADLNMVEYPC